MRPSPKVFIKDLPSIQMAVRHLPIKETTPTISKPLASGSRVQAIAPVKVRSILEKMIPCIESAVTSQQPGLTYQERGKKIIARVEPPTGKIIPKKYAIKIEMKIIRSNLANSMVTRVLNGSHLSLTKQQTLCHRQWMQYG